MTRVWILLAALALGACTKIELDCKNGTVKVSGDVTVDVAAARATELLKACPK